MQGILFESQGSVVQGILVSPGAIFKIWPDTDFRMKSTLKEELGAYASSIWYGSSFDTEVFREEYFVENMYWYEQQMTSLQTFSSLAFW